jgi:hypothetical protein
MTMPLGKSPALTPHRFAAERLDSRLRGNGLYLGREPIPTTGRTPFSPRVNEKNFFVVFKAGMLLKTRESKTKCMNLKGLISTEMREFCKIRIKLGGFCNVRGESGGLLGEALWQRQRISISLAMCMIINRVSSIRDDSGRNLTL